MCMLKPGVEPREAAGSCLPSITCAWQPQLSSSKEATVCSLDLPTTSPDTTTLRPLTLSVTRYRVSDQQPTGG